MAYRKSRRSRPRRDPETGVAYARLRREVPDYYLFSREEPNPGGFDLEIWADHNDPTCAPEAGGVCNTRSMAALTGYGERTFVNSVLPLIPYEREGPVLISATNTVCEAGRIYRAEMRARMSAGGRRRPTALTDVSSGGAPASAAAPPLPRHRPR